jgi:hypothetical protein
MTPLTQANKILFPNMTNASIPVVTMLRSSLSVYVFFYTIKILLLIASLINSSLELTFRIALVVPKI